ncbi:FeoA family protein [Rheinheimera baltica]|uniref:FeoA family protein n=1 Tax=Rheinheimera baltica TaxID=67576 RepID=A0ABT9HWV4_9GAMM|nr:FeoA family protein [Rheinheimera baltica]MDP5135604.1 FeoA family protein [Rheinheimera baltica]
MMSLWDTAGGQTVTVTTLDAGLDQAVSSRLREMGLENGLPVLCLRRGPFNGALVVAIADCVYSLEQKIASKIRVKPL